jgi:hypothetical protein
VSDARTAKGGGTFFLSCSLALNARSDLFNLLAPSFWTRNSHFHLKSSFPAPPSFTKQDKLVKMVAVGDSLPAGTFMEVAYTPELDDAKACPGPPQKIDVLKAFK